MPYVTQSHPAVSLLLQAADAQLEKIRDLIGKCKQKMAETAAKYDEWKVGRGKVGRRPSTTSGRWGGGVRGPHQSYQ